MEASPGRCEAVSGYTLFLSSPFFDQHLGLPRGFKRLPVEQLTPELSVKTLHITILSGASRLDEQDPHPNRLQQVPTRGPAASRIAQRSGCATPAMPRLAVVSGGFPWARTTSASRSFIMICSAVNRFFGHACLLPKPKILTFKLDSF